MATAINKTQFENTMSALAGNFTDPIIVCPGGWGDTLPPWLKQAITLERLETLTRGVMTGTDAEACAYLYTACLNAPLDSDWTQIYLYVSTKTYSYHRSKESGGQVPEDIRVESLNDYQMGELRRLKNSIYNTRIRQRQEHDRADRREKREEESARKKAERPLLFEF